MNPRNTAGPHRCPPSSDPIDPALCYPIRALSKWGFGARSVAALQRAGLPALQFGKLKFFRGVDLIAALERGGSVAEQQAAENGPQGGTGR
jgi:hypothetical protein